MARNILIGLLILILPACNETKKPEGILSEKQMVQVMTELYLVEEKAGKVRITYDSLRKIFPMFSERALEKSGTSDSVFHKSIEYYMTDPEKLERIYTILVDSLNLKAQRTNVPKKSNDLSE